MKTLLSSIFLFACLTGPSLLRGAVTVNDYYKFESDEWVGDNFAYDSKGTTYLMSGTPAPDYGQNAGEQAMVHLGSRVAATFSTPGSWLASAKGLLSTTTDDFGLEAWVYPSGDAGVQTVAYNGNPALDGWGIAQVGNTVQGRFGSTFFGSAAVTPGTWVHVALVRDSGVATLYVNGVSSGTLTLAPSAPTGLFTVGASGPAPYGDFFSGAVDELRLFTFTAGQFTTDDLLLRVPDLDLEQPAGTPIARGGGRDMGTVALGSSSTMAFAIRNSGATPLIPLTARFTGLDASQFTVAIQPAGPLAPGDSATATVQCTPVTAGPKSALLQIYSNDPDESPYTIALSATVPAPQLSVSLGLRTFLSGTVTGQGWGYQLSPVGLTGVRALSGGLNFMAALRGDGTVVSWGLGGGGALDVPQGLHSVIGISAAYNHCLAVKADGTVVSWGLSDSGAATVPAGLSGVAALATSSAHTLALKTDGSIVGWGDDTYHQVSWAPTGTGFSAISASYSHGMALRTNGTVVCWGSNLSGQCTVPAGLANIVAISAGSDYSMALSADGKVSFWGQPYLRKPSTTLPPIVAISAGNNVSVAIDRYGRGFYWGAEPGELSPQGMISSSQNLLRSGISYGYQMAVIADAVLPLGSRTMGDTPVEKTLTLHSSGQLPLHPGAITLSGPDSAEFAIVTTGIASEIPPGADASITVRFTPGAVGVKNATLQINGDDPMNGNFVIPLTATSTVSGELQVWRQTWFGTASNSGISADTADPNGNGIPNVLEYALGGDPLGTTTGISILPKASVDDAGLLHLDFNRYVSRTDLQLTVQGSSDLRHWNDIAYVSGGALVSPHYFTLSESGAGDVRAVSLVEIPGGTAPAPRYRYLRLRVDTP